jgi:hypothetical protein
MNKVRGLVSDAICEQKKHGRAFNPTVLLALVEEQMN